MNSQLVHSLLGAVRPKATLCAASRTESRGVKTADHGQQCAPPNGCMQLGQDSAGRMGPLHHSTRANENAVDQQQDADKKPNGNDEMFSWHIGYQKIHCRIANTARTTPAQKIGRAYNGWLSSLGKGVKP